MSYLYGPVGIAALIGIPFNVKTDAQLEQEIADQYDAAEKRKEDYNATLTPGTEITVDMELDGENKKILMEWVLNNYNDERKLSFKED